MPRDMRLREDKIAMVPFSGCHVWMGATNNRGYAVVTIDGAQHLGHRVSYTHTKGPIPEGLELDHLCRVRCCVNPDHLEPVTHTENMQRSPNRGNGGAYQRAKTHCPSGHEYTTDNTYYRANGDRFCKACNQERKQRAKEKS